MKHLTKYALILSLYVMTYNVKAQDANKSSFSLQEAIDYALKHSPNYLNSELDLQNANYKRKEITGQGLPQITGSLDLKDYLNLPTSLLPGQILGGAPGTYLPVKFGTKYNATAGLNASETISSDYFFGLTAQREYMNLSKISVTRSKADLVSQVTKAYYTVVISRDRIKSLEANIAKLKKSYDDTKAANVQGTVEMIDVERLQVQYNNLITDRDKTVKLVELSESVLKFQMGYKIEDPISLSDNLNSDNNAFQELSTNKLDISQRPDYKLLQSQQVLYDLDVKRQKYGFLPSLNIYGSVQYNAQRSTFTIFEASGSDITKSWYNIALVGATLNFNLYTGWQRMNRLEQAKITAFKNQNMIKNLELNAQLEASTASVNYSNAYATLLRQKKNVELAEHVVDVARKKYENGVGSNIEVVTAESSLTEAQTNYYNSVFDMVVAKVDYLKATGTLVK
jgi:outer membrane protein